MRTILISLLVLFCSVSDASLLKADLFSPGDNLITRDTETGLEWLDLTATLNLSIIDVNNNVGGWKSLGFRYATELEVTELFLNSGPESVISSSPHTGYIGPVPENRDGVKLLQSLMGITYHLNQANDFDIVGFGLYLNYDAPHSDIYPVRGGTYTANDEDTLFALNIDDGFWVESYSYSGAGSFLVREGTPTTTNEGICDDLKATGITKGLYGLCVAFCEAQEITNISNPITEDELEALIDATPSGRILENYNKRRDIAAGDPTMPCIAVEDPPLPPPPPISCPCWSSSQLAQIDGVNYLTGSVTAQHACTVTDDETQHYEQDSLSDGHYVNVARTMIDDGGGKQCFYTNLRVILVPSPSISGTILTLDISEEEHNKCREAILEHCEQGL